MCFKTRRKAVRAVAVIMLATGLTGCSKVAEVRKETAERRWLTGESRTFVVNSPTLVARLDHVILRSTRGQKAGELAGAGAKGGALLWVGMVMESDEGKGLALILTPIMLPAFAIIGAAGGAVVGATNAEPVVSRVEDPADSVVLAPTADAFDSFAGLADNLRDILIHESEKISHHRFVTERYGEPGNGRIDISSIDASLQSWNDAPDEAWLRFELTAELMTEEGGFRRKASGTGESKSYPLGDWAAAGGQLLREELDRAMRDTARQVALELLGKTPPEEHVPYVDPNLRRGRPAGLN